MRGLYAHAMRLRFSMEKSLEKFTSLFSWRRFDTSRGGVQRRECGCLIHLFFVSDLGPSQCLQTNIRNLAQWKRCRWFRGTTTFPTFDLVSVGQRSLSFDPQISCHSLKSIFLALMKDRILKKQENSSSVFSRGHATLHLAMSVGRSVCRSICHIFEFRAVFAILLLPSHPRLDCRISGLVKFPFQFPSDLTMLT